MFSERLKQTKDGVSLDISNAIFVTNKQNLNRTYQTVSESFYGVDVTSIDFGNLVKSADIINSYIAKATQNRIKTFVSLGDLKDAQILVTSVLFFKGKWKSPFNKTATFTDKFVDEKGNAKGEVKMMYIEDSFPYTMVPHLKGHAIEIPYGKGDKMSMIIILPRQGEPLSTTLKLLAATPVTVLLDALSQAETDFEDQNVQVYLPRFTITSDLNLNAVLSEMGVKDVFNEDLANLLGIFPNYLYLSRVIQRAKIQVDEEGTTASAVAGGTLEYRIPPPKFYANRPFVYLIVDKQTTSILFAGTVTNPSTICDSC